MSLIVAGSIGIDNIITPQARQEGLLGGSVSYAALAASVFCKPVHLCGVVGHDFPKAHLDMLAARGIELDSLERSSGESFTWTGEYFDDMNSRTTHKVGINVLEHWKPKLSAQAAGAKIAVLANMSPDNQIQTIDQCAGAEFFAADTMDLWINIANERLHDMLKRIDLLVINDGEAKQFARDHQPRRGRPAPPGEGAALRRRQARRARQLPLRRRPAGILRLLGLSAQQRLRSDRRGRQLPRRHDGLAGGERQIEAEVRRLESRGRPRQRHRQLHLRSLQHPAPRACHPRGRGGETGGIEELHGVRGVRIAAAR